MNIGEIWEEAMEFGLRGSTLVVLLVSAGALKGIVEDASK